MDGAAAAPEAHGLQRVAERAPDGQPMLQDEELARSFPGVSLVLGDGRDLGAGSLFITTRYGLSVHRPAPHLQLLTPSAQARHLAERRGQQPGLQRGVHADQPARYFQRHRALSARLHLHAARRARARQRSRRWQRR